MSRHLQSEIITRARQLLEDRKRWTSYASARDPSGRKCTPFEDRAVRYCAYGALLRSAYQVTGCRKQAEKLARTTERMVTGDNRLSQVNDKRGYRAVLRLIEAASKGVR
jgi:hypothetical protein